MPTKATQSWPSGAPAKTKKRRRKQINLPYQTPLRFGDAELVAVDEMRAALATVRNKPLEAITFSEAARLLIRDKASAARIEAQAKVIASDPSFAAPAEVPAEVLDLFNDLQRLLGHCQGSLNSVAKNINFARKALGCRLTQEQVDEALAEVHRLRDWLDVQEHVAVLGAAPKATPLDAGAEQ